MVDGLTQKLITVTDGVSYPVISSTTYPITYTNADDANPTCHKVEFYSDNTSYISSTAQTRTRVGNFPVKPGVMRPIYIFVGVTEIDIYNKPQKLFPYLITNDSNTQLWSDGRTYSKI
jgi:hypothetical protein